MALVAYLKSHHASVCVCSLSRVFLCFSTVLRNPEHEVMLYCSATNTTAEWKDGSHSAHRVVGFVWCIHKPESFSSYQTGVYASQLRDLVLSPHLLSVPPLTAEYTSLKLLPTSFGEHLKEEWANGDVIQTPPSKCPCFVEERELLSLDLNFDTGRRPLRLNPPCRCQLRSCSRSRFCSEH